MSKFLDKTISVRQIWRWTLGIFFVAIPLYVMTVFLNAWGLKTGGVSLNYSPFKEHIPERCLAYAQRSFGTPAGRTLTDEFLLRGRLRRGPIEGFVNGPDLTAACLGYAVLGGLHDKTAGDANFIEQRIDVNGDPVITVRVEYNKPYVAESGSKK